MKKLYNIFGAFILFFTVNNVRAQSNPAMADTEFRIRCIPTIDSIGTTVQTVHLFKHLPTREDSLKIIHSGYKIINEPFKNAADSIDFYKPRKNIQ